MLDPAGRNKVACDLCDGVGKIRRKKCSGCGGSGHVDYTPESLFNCCFHFADGTASIWPMPIAMIENKSIVTGRPGVLANIQCDYTHTDLSGVRHYMEAGAAKGTRTIDDLAKAIEDAIASIRPRVGGFSLLASAQVPVDELWVFDGRGGKHILKLPHG